MPYPRILALVEGTMEKKFINNNFSYIELIPVANGNSWTLETICREIASKFTTKNYNADIIIVWLDLEKQTCGSVGVENAVRSALISAGAPHDRICICIPDRMTENVILADVALIQQKFSIPNYVYAGDGVNGKHQLSMLFKAANENYKETFHGVQMMKAMRLSNSAQNSPSMGRFYNSISQLTDCWWF